MAQLGYTPIIPYYSVTATNTPTTISLGEIAINIPDKTIFIGTGANAYDVLYNPSTDAGTPLNTPDTNVRRDGYGNFASGLITADLSGGVSVGTSTLSTTNFTISETGGKLVISYGGRSSTLNGAINSSVTTITLANAGSFAASGSILIGTEIITYSGKSTNSLTGCVRGASGTTAASHSDGVTVYGGAITTLNGDITSSATSLTLTSASAFASSGIILIGTELISYTGKSTNTLTGCVRGVSGTTAATHLTGAPSVQAANPIVSISSTGVITTVTDVVVGGTI